MILELTPEQYQKLEETQRLYLDALKNTEILANHYNCRSRTALHHLIYKRMRAGYPQLGSQLISSVIYKVCEKTGKFRTNSIVYDKNTFSIKDNELSLFSIGGRIKIPLTENPKGSLLEVVCEGSKCFIIQ